VKKGRPSKGNFVNRGSSETAKKLSKKIRLIQVNIRKPAEVRWLHRFIRDHHSSPGWVLPSLADLKNPTYRDFKAYLGEEFIGVSGYEIRTPYLVETHRTIIAPDFRGKGIGGALSWAMEREVRRAGFKKIRSTIYAQNLPMIAIKLAQGFQIEGFHPEHDAPGLHEYSLGKLLR
jgi:RimJ/RimL family protein N-acetyltransferase